jgi:hypothetical protein
MTLTNGLVGAVLTYALALRLGVESVGWATIAALLIGRVPLQILAIRSKHDATLNVRHFLRSSYGVTSITVLACLAAWAAAQMDLRLDPLPLRVALITGCACVASILAFVGVHGWAVGRVELERALGLGRLIAGGVVRRVRSGEA